MSAASSPMNSPSVSSNDSFEVDSAKGASPVKAPANKASSPTVSGPTTKQSAPTAQASVRPASSGTTAFSQPSSTPAAPQPNRQQVTGGAATPQANLTASASTHQHGSSQIASTPTAKQHQPMPAQPEVSKPAGPGVSHHGGASAHTTVQGAESPPSKRPVDGRGAPVASPSSQREPGSEKKEPSVSSLDSTDDPQPSVRTTRILTAEQFKKLFQTDIAGLHEAVKRTSGPGCGEREPSPNRQHSPARRGAGGAQASRSGDGRRPHSASSRAQRSSSRPVDPYSGTRYGTMMAYPPPPSKVAHKLRKSVMTKSDGAFQSAAVPDGSRSPRSRPGTAGGAAGGGNSGHHHLQDEQQIMRQTDQILQMKLQIQLKDQRIHQLLRQKGQLEQDNAHLAATKFARHAAAGELQPADEVIIGLKSRIGYLEERLRLSEEEVQTVKHSSKSLRISTLNEQTATYLAEVQRLKCVLREKERDERRGADGAALSEAQALVNSKDAQLHAMHEKCRALKAQLKAALAEATSAKADREHAVNEAQQLRGHMTSVREAPAEVLRLQMELKLAEERLGDARGELKRIAGDRDAQTRTAQDRDGSAAAAMRERDAMRAQLEQTQMQLKAFDTAADAKTARAVEDAKRDADQRLKEAMLFAQDREATLRADAKEQRDRVRDLEAQIAKLVADHKDDIETMKAKELQRQENMLRTISAYDKESQQTQAKTAREIEERLGAERETNSRERARLEAEVGRLKQQIAELSAAQQQPSTQVPDAALRAQLEREAGARAEAKFSERLERADKEHKERVSQVERETRDKLEREYRDKMSKEVDARVQEERQRAAQAEKTERESAASRTEAEARDRVERETRDRLERENRERIDRVERETRDRVERETRDRVERETRDRVERETRDRVERETRDRVEREPRDRVERETREREAAAARALDGDRPASASHLLHQATGGNARYGDTKQHDLSRVSVDSTVIGGAESVTPRESTSTQPRAASLPHGVSAVAVPIPAPPAVTTKATPASAAAAPVVTATAEHSAATTAGSGAPTTTAVAAKPKAKAAAISISDDDDDDDDDEDDDDDTFELSQTKPKGSVPAPKPASSPAVPAVGKVGPAAPAAAPKTSPAVAAVAAPAPRGKSPSSSSASSDSSDAEEGKDGNFSVESD